MLDIPNRIEALKRRLYQRDEPRFAKTHGELAPVKVETKTTWIDEEDLPKKEIVGMSFLKRVLVASIIFFLGVVGFSAYVFFGGANVVSPEKIDIIVNGPVSVKGGDPLSLEIRLENNNNVALADVQLIVKYPTGTRSVDDFSQENSRFQKYIGELKSGEPYVETVSAVLFGAEQSTQTIDIQLDYRVPGSHAVYPKTKTFSILLTSAPISLSTKFPKEVNSSQEIEFSVNLTSNSPNVLRDILTQVSYPAGFIYKSAIPSPTYGNNVWEVGDLPVSASREIKIRGIIEGQNQDLKAFRVASGIRSQSNEREIGVIYSSTFETMTVERPFVSVALELNSTKEGVLIINSGESIKGSVNLENNLPTIVTDIDVGLRISGNYLNTSVRAQKGFYRSNEDKIVWTKLESPDLSSMEPNSIRKLAFTLSAQTLAQLRAVRANNPTINFDLVVRGKRNVADSQSEIFETKIARSVKINAISSFGAKLLHFTGPIANSGPIPPRADQITTYTLVITAGSSINNLNDGRVTFTLPSYVKWVGVVSPSDEDVTFNTETNQGVWNVGSIRNQDGPREVAVQISFQPSVTQGDTFPTTVSNIVFSAVDSFTGTRVSVVGPKLTSRLSEVGYTEEMGKVLK